MHPPLLGQSGKDVALAGCLVIDLHQANIAVTRKSFDYSEPLSQPVADLRCHADIFEPRADQAALFDVLVEAKLDPTSPPSSVRLISTAFEPVPGRAGEMRPAPSELAVPFLVRTKAGNGGRHVPHIKLPLVADQGLKATRIRAQGVSLE